MEMPRARTFYGLIADWAAAAPDRDFLVDHRQRLSYAGFLAEVRTTARALRALGVRAGDKVAVLMGNQAEWIVVDFAAAALGAVTVAMNTWWKAAEVAQALVKADVRVLVMSDRYLKNDFSGLIRSLGDLSARLPLLRDIVVLGDDRPPGAIGWNAFRARADEVSPAELDAAIAAVEPDQPANILFTSGSTGEPKAVLLTHRGCIENCFQIGERMHLGPDDRMLVSSALFWSMCCINALFATVTHGATLVVLHAFEAGEALRVIEAEGCTVIYAVPGIVESLHAHPDRRPGRLGRWRTGIASGHGFLLAEEMGATELVSAFGLTECYGFSTVGDGKAPREVRMRNSGWPLAGVEAVIVDPETRKPVPPGELGELRLRGQVTPGYYKDAERTAQAIDAEGWFHTGDLCVIEADGSLAWKARHKDLMKVGGISVAPAEVEFVLMQHPAVRLAVVVSLPDPVRGEAIGALVVPQSGVDVTEAELLAHCRATTASYRIPALIRFVAEAGMPVTGTGKPQKQAIRAMLLAQRDEAAA